MTSFILQAGKAFGSGAHPSTQGALMALDFVKVQGGAPKRILDMGCGSGVLSLAAAALWPRTRITAVDIEEAAVAMTRDNAAENGCADQVHALRADSYAALAAEPPFDLIAANMLADIHVKLASGLTPVLAPGAVVILSGILAWLLPQVVAAYRQIGFHVYHEIPVADWRTVVLRAEPA